MGPPAHPDRGDVCRGAAMNAGRFWLGARKRRLPPAQTQGVRAGSNDRLMLTAASVGMLTFASASALCSLRVVTVLAYLSTAGIGLGLYALALLSSRLR